jgi:alpha-galactosidase
MLTRRIAVIASCANGGVQRVCSTQRFRYAVFDMNEASATGGAIAAVQFTGAPDGAGFPTADAWNSAKPVRFAADWRGTNEDQLRETEVRILWTNQIFHLRFRCRYRTLTVFADGDSDGRRDQLWDRDVAEVFIQTEPSQPQHYLEFEISPNGMWIDLDISPGEKRDSRSGMKSRVNLHEAGKVWTGEIAIPMRSLTRQFDQAAKWRINFFRVEGATEPRFYSAWHPTFTPAPNFHVPKAFGTLYFHK